ncbi:protein kinase [Nonomuraea sp. NPDC052265]|uniref:serine/threonine-protein kinase n=1 Tax=Nonomuraea sp. NPDC052265 TaxID=3364374 RepID=UPI0037CBAF59
MPETHPLQPGDPRSLGVYRLLERLGKGAQGVVFKAEGPDGRLVAIKLLNTLLNRPGLDGERFLREVAAARRVAQFCTAQVLGASMDGEQPYIVSELVDGVSLQVVVQREGPREGGVLYRLAVGTVTALAAIHRAGIVHRDFKPSNVLVGTDGPRVIDFGIARALDSAVTISSGVVGTPAYMSPEQISAERVGPASDMFSWALTMLYAATGRPAFGQDTLPAVIYRVMNEEPDLSALPDELRPLVQACLSKRAEDRPTAADALFALLENQGAAVELDDEVALNTGSQLAANHPHPTPTPPRPAPTTPPLPGPPLPDPGHPGPSLPGPPVSGSGLPGPQVAPVPTGWANPSGASYAPPPVAPGGRPPGHGPSAPGAPAAGPSGPRPPAPGAPPVGSPVPGVPSVGSPVSGAPVVGSSGPKAGREQEGDTRYVRQAPPTHYGPPQRLPPPYPMGARPQPAASGNDAFFRHAPAVDRPDEVKARRRRAIMVSSALVVALALAGGVLFLGPTMFGPETPPTPNAAGATETIPPSPGLPTVQPTTQPTTQPTPPSTLAPSSALTPTPTPTQTIPPSQAVAALGKQDGKSLKGHTKGVQTISALSLGDGRTWLVSGGQDGRVRLWDLGKHKPLATMKGHSEEVYAVAAVMIGKTPMAVSGGYDGSVRLWNLKTHKGKVLGWHGDAVYSVALTRAGGKWIAVTGDAKGWLRFWDLKKRKATGRTIKAHRTSVNWLNATHLGDRAIVVSAGEDATLRLWDVTRHKAYGKAYKGHAKGVYAVTTGRLGDRIVVASGGKDRKIRIWDPKTGKTIGSPLAGHKNIVYSLSFGTLGGRTVLLSGSTDGTIRLWDPDTHKPLGKPVKAHKRGVYAVGIVPSGGDPVVVSAGKDKVIRVWKPKRDAGS